MPEGNTSVPAAGSSNKMWYIIGGVVALILVGWFLTRGSSMGPLAGVGGERNMDGSTTYSNEDGSVTVGGNSMPDNWPSDAPAAYSGATIVYSGSTNPQTGQAGSALSYTVTASVESVVYYYKAQLEANGWTIAASANVGGANVISATKDTRTMGVYVTDAGNGTTAVTAGIEL